jgi:hypothetical protein
MFLIVIVRKCPSGESGFGARIGNVKVEFIGSAMQLECFVTDKFHDTGSSLKSS